MKRDALVGAVRERLTRYPPPFESHYGMVPPPPETRSVGLGTFAKVQHEAVAAMARIEVMAQEYHDPYVLSRVLSRKEAVSSSSIEGTNSTLDELLSVEEQDEDAQSAALQVRGYARVLDTVLARASELGPDVFTIDLFRELHASVMKDDDHYDDEPGQFRTRVVWIGGGRGIENSTYNPAPPDDIEPCLHELVDYLRDNGEHVLTQPLMMRMAIAHAHFEAVHPFRDGNGRVGRLLLPLMMAAEKLTPIYMSGYIDANRQAYYDGLKQAQQRLEFAPLAGYFSQAVVASEKELMTTRNALERLHTMWLDRRRFRANSAAALMLDVLPHYPVTTIGRMASILGVSFNAAKAGIDQLIEANILSERTGYKRNRIFSAPEVLDILNRPFGADWDYEAPDDYQEERSFRP
ncbi:Fic family protein [Pelagibacterium mangrovi]|uniref:Fic family protein n=1 Tax=Pelagibacterium mangrovi TaxID=3119828 RepID=UPI002FC59C1A